MSGYFYPYPRFLRNIDTEDDLIEVLNRESGYEQDLEDQVHSGRFFVNEELDNYPEQTLDELINYYGSIELPRRFPRRRIRGQGLRQPLYQDPLYQEQENIQEAPQLPLPANIDDYTIDDLRRAARINPQPVKDYINQIPWLPGIYGNFDKFMMGEEGSTLGRCKGGINCAQNSLWNLITNKSTTRSRDVSPTTAYREARAYVPNFETRFSRGISSKEEAMKDLFHRLYEYDPNAVTPPSSEEEVESLSSENSKSDSQSPEQRFPWNKSSSSESSSSPTLQRGPQENRLPRLSDVDYPNLPKNTIAYDRYNGPFGHTILKDSNQPSGWRSLQSNLVSRMNPDARDVIAYDDIGYKPPQLMTYTRRFK